MKAIIFYHKTTHKSTIQGGLGGREEYIFFIFNFHWLHQPGCFYESSIYLLYFILYSLSQKNKIKKKNMNNNFIV